MRRHAHGQHCEGWPFRIEAEFSVASGVRRIEAVTGLEFFRQNEENNLKLMEMANVLKSSPFEMVEKAKAAMSDIKELRRKVEALQDKLRSGELDGFIASAKKVGDLRVITATRPGSTADEMRRAGDFLRDKAPNLVAVFAAVEGEDKITFFAVCGKNAVEKGVKAGDLIKQVTAMTGGRGGGQARLCHGRRQGYAHAGQRSRHGGQLCRDKARTFEGGEVNGWLPFLHDIEG